MIADIVKESTDLEYPDDENTAKSPRKPLNLPFLRFKFKIRRKSTSEDSTLPEAPQKPPTTNQQDQNTQQNATATETAQNSSQSPKNQQTSPKTPENNVEQPFEHPEREL